MKEIKSVKREKIKANREKMVVKGRSIFTLQKIKIEKAKRSFKK